MASSGDSRAYRKGHRSSQGGKEFVGRQCTGITEITKYELNKLFFMPAVRKREFIQYVKFLHTIEYLHCSNKN